MKKIIIFTGLASAITMGLFAFMAFLINSDKVEITKSEDYVPIELYKIPEPKKVKPPKSIPPKPKVVDIPQPIKPSRTVNGGITIPDPNIDIAPTKPKLTFDKTTKDINHDAHPIVRVTPKYPPEAIRKGIEGWVKLKFDINNLGEVVNVEVISSDPKRIFDKEAKRALLKWKYKAKAIEGEYVKQENLSVQLDFQMEKAG